LDAIARRYEPKVRDAMLAAWAALRGQIPVGQIADAMSQGAEAVLALLATARLPEAALLRAIGPLVEGLQATATATSLSIGIRWGVPDQRATQWVLSTADANGWLRYNIDSEARNLIRQTVQQAFLEGGHPYQTARLIRGSIGLNAQQTAALQRFGEGLTQQGISGGAWEKAVARQEARYLKYRAEMIARTETHRAVQQGQLEAWREGADSGLYERERTWRVWIATSGACDICAALDGSEVGLDEEWPGYGYEADAHVNCMCAQGLSFHD
jgi:hypothetical protein